ncbi:MAG: hypothetical protein KJP07_23775 [Desulfatitalea sp.]|nr:hypothetical protein [Desulfatitalea sp.]
MSNPIANYPEPPYDVVMPANWQLVFTILLGAVALLFWGYAIYLYKKERDPMPILAMIGGTICPFVEPLVDNLGLVWFPIHDNWVWHSSFGREIPIMVAFAYMWYFGAFTYLTANQFKKGISARQVWKWFFVMVFIEFCLEPIPINLGLWMYYGKQPFLFFGFPLWWPVINATGMFCAALLVHKMRPHLKGWSVLLIALLVPSGDMMGNAAAGWPLWAALNSNHGYAVTYAAGCLTLFLCVVFIKVVATMVEVEGNHQQQVAISEQ